MNKEITAQVHMLPTEFSRLCITNGVLSLHSHKYQRNKWDDTRHLYFLSDEEIKEGDWVVNTAHAELYKAQDWQLIHMKNLRHCIRKVVASTDPSLGLPAIPTAWIRDVYIPSNGSIKEVKLELEFNHALKSMATESRIKLTPNNEVVIVDEPTMETLFPKEQCGDLSVDQELNDAAGKSATETHPRWEIIVDDTKFDANHQGRIGHYHGFINGAEWQKEQLSIPTDEEIEKKAEQSAIEWWKSEPDPETDKFFTEEFNEVKEKWAKQDYCCGYEAGYKQALKDLGYE